MTLSSKAKRITFVYVRVEDLLLHIENVGLAEKKQQQQKYAFCILKHVRPCDLNTQQSMCVRCRKRKGS